MCKASPANDPEHSGQESSFPLPLGPMGTAGVSGLGPLLLRRCSIVLVHGENYFSERVGGEEAALTVIKVGCQHTSIHAPDPTIYTVCTHTHTRPWGERACHCFAFNCKAV